MRTRPNVEARARTSASLGPPDETERARLSKLEPARGREHGAHVLRRLMNARKRGHAPQDCQSIAVGSRKALQ